MTPQNVLDFWFAEENRPLWFAKSDEFDQAIRSRFADLWQQAARAELYGWRATLEGRLAEIIGSTNSRATCSATARKPSPATPWRKCLPKKPPNSPVLPICPTHGGT